MRFLLAAIVVAALGWFGYWFIGQHSLQTAFSSWLDARRIEGWVAETSDLRIQGFPNRFDIGFSDLMLADPETGLAWQAPFFQILMLSYRPNHAIAVWPEEQLIATPVEKYRVQSNDMRASLVIAPDTRLAPERGTLTAEFLRITPAGRPDDTTALSALTLAAERQEGTRYRLGLSAEGLTLSPQWRARLDPQDRLPGQISGLHADLDVTFDKPWDRTAIEQSRPQPTAIRLSLADAKWGQLHLQAAGAVTVTDEGFPEGEITLKARNWRDMLELATASGALPQSLAQTLESGLSLIAQMNGNPQTLDVPLTFRNGRTLLGPIPLGPAPVLRLR
ncbi:hypothetical protein SAMN05443999_110123 [Roseovarius azorensis]|uniref:DUF2125 domain-containing protein n=1 Tax=Roseovarius azorensis TaxID=1287727 RepID=A0A1H7UKR5_9RHOB|nr:DUF2125 domain-containing protein [Roseovarius azorensis]SEL97541.1 hypothetical protein SAMN05443999_110123 [Roseovarius azorensis]